MYKRQLRVRLIFDLVVGDFLKKERMRLGLRVTIKFLGSQSVVSQNCELSAIGDLAQKEAELTQVVFSMLPKIFTAGCEA